MRHIVIANFNYSTMSLNYDKSPDLWSDMNYWRTVKTCCQWQQSLFILNGQEISALIVLFSGPFCRLPDSCIISAE